MGKAGKLSDPGSDLDDSHVDGDGIGWHGSSGMALRDMQMERLCKAMAEAYSIESKPDMIKMEQIGRVEKGERIYILYEDVKGRYWYEVRFRELDGREINTYEKVFGRKEHRWK